MDPAGVVVVDDAGVGNGVCPITGDDVGDGVGAGVGSGVCPITGDGVGAVVGDVVGDSVGAGEDTGAGVGERQSTELFIGELPKLKGLLLRQAGQVITSITVSVS